MKKVKPLPKKKPLRPTFIRAWRKSLELTLEQVAARVAEISGDEKFTHATLSRIERAKIGYTQRRLEAIAEALGREPADLIIRDPSDKSAPWSIYDALKKADAPHRERIMAVVEALAKTGT